MNNYRPSLQQRLTVLIGGYTLLVFGGGTVLAWVVGLESWLFISGTLLVTAIFIVWLTYHFVNQVGAETQPQIEEQPNQKPVLVETVEGANPTTYVTPKKYHEQVAQKSSEGLIIHDTEWIHAINAAGVRLLGLKETQEISRLPLLTTLSADYQEKLNSFLAQTKQVASLEATLRKPDGTDIEVELVQTPLIRSKPPLAQLLIKDRMTHKDIVNELNERTRQLAIVQTAGVAIISRLDLRYVLDTVSEEMTKLFEVETCTIYEWNREQNIIIQMAQYGPSGWWDYKQDVTYELAQHPLTKSVLEEQIPQQMTINQATTDPSEVDYMRQAKIKTQMLLPMVYQRRVIGLATLSDSRAERKFSYQEISLAKLLGNQAASAIENAKLYNQAQQEIVDRKRAEADLKEERALLAKRVQERTAELSKANAELGRAARLKDEFLAGMSHELRTPLNSILGSAEILQAEVFGELNERQQKYLHNTEESGRHLLTLINDILDLSKVEAGKLEVDIGPVSVVSVCEASVRLVKQLAHKKKLNLTQRINDNVDYAKADERRLKQILVNLLSNAIKFTPENGQIGLDVSTDSEHATVHFTVWDTGIGIQPEDLKRLFQPFVQLDSRLAREYEGTGLGLSLVLKMVELHNGSVSVESEPGQGSRFTVSIPETKRPQRQTESSNGDIKTIIPSQITLPSEDRAPLILLAEDNEANIEMVTDFMQIYGYQILVARNGVEAIERARETKPDAILMDIQMPALDGLAATRQLRTEPDFAHTPIIALTALAMPGDRETSLEAGANAYLSKPISPKELIQILDQYLNIERPIERI